MKRIWLLLAPFILMGAYACSDANASHTKEKVTMYRISSGTQVYTGVRSYATEGNCISFSAKVKHGCSSSVRMIKMCGNYIVETVTK